MGPGEGSKDKADEVRDKAEDAVEKLAGDERSEAGAGQQPSGADRGGPSEAAKNAKNDWDIAKD